MLLHVALTLFHRHIGPIVDLSVVSNVAGIAISRRLGFAL
jgi:hypothetical protein